MGDLNVHSTVGVTEQMAKGDVTSGLHHCFSTVQESEEEIQEKQLKYHE